MQPPATPTRSFRFGLFEADVSNRILTRNGVRVKIQDQPFRVLLLLLEHPGEIVSRDQLRSNLWPDGTHVDFDGSLNVILKKLRAVLDDDSDNPRFIETVPRSGYRFIAPVTGTRIEMPAPTVSAVVERTIAAADEVPRTLPFCNSKRLPAGKDSRTDPLCCRIFGHRRRRHLRLDALGRPTANSIRFQHFPRVRGPPSSIGSCSGVSESVRFSNRNLARYRIV